MFLCVYMCGRGLSKRCLILLWLILTHFPPLYYEHPPVTAIEHAPAICYALTRCHGDTGSVF